MAKTCKYQKLQRYVSYDNGATWQAMEEYQRGALIEADSPDCGGGTIFYRWVEMPSGTSYVCVGYDKYTEERKQQSTDGGATWTDVSPLETRSGSTLIEENSTDCGYVPPIETKWIAYYRGGSVSSAACDSSSAITDGEIVKENLEAARMGDCVTGISMNAFYGSTVLTSVTIPTSVTSIGESAFQNCTSLWHVTLPNSLTYIGNNAFYNSGLEDLKIPSSVTYIGDNAFANCTILTAITATSITPPQIGSNVFDNTNCPIYVPCESVMVYRAASGWSDYASRIRGMAPCIQYRWQPSGYTCQGYDKYQNNIRQITYDSGVTWENVVPEEYSASTLIEANSFDCMKWHSTYSDGATKKAACNSGSYYGIITELEVPRTNDNFWLSDVYIGSCVASLDRYAFGSYNTSYREPAKMTAVTFSEDSQLTYLGEGAFRWCDRLKTIELPNTLQTMDFYAFYGCSALTEIVIPDSVTTIRGSAFWDCIFLTDVTIGSGVTYFGAGAFQGCVNLTSVTFSENSSLLVLEGNFFRTCSKLTELVIPDSVTAIRSNAIMDCSILSSVTFGSGVTEIGSQAINLCPRISEIIIKATTPPQIGSNAFDMYNATIYVPCESVEAYRTAVGWSNYGSRIQGIPPCEEPPLHPKWVATYRGGTTASAHCDSISAISNIGSSTLESIFIGDCVTEISDSCFKKSSGLTTIDIPNNVTSIGVSAFTLCVSLSSFTNANYVTSIGDGAFSECRRLTSTPLLNNVTSIGIGAFSGCTSLGYFVIPNGVTEIKDSTFNRCTSLASIDIPSGVTKIGDEAFSSAITLSSVTIPDSVASIGFSAFSHCYGLTSATIGSGVTSIGYRAFYWCYRMQSLTIYATTPPTLGSEAFDSPYVPPQEVIIYPIYVPSGSVEAYKSASRWSAYASRIQPIPNS